MRSQRWVCTAAGPEAMVWGGHPARRVELGPSKGWEARLYRCDLLAFLGWGAGGQASRSADVGVNCIRETPLQKHLETHVGPGP